MAKEAYANGKRDLFFDLAPTAKEAYHATA
jgi:hypothetical protein